MTWLLALIPSQLRSGLFSVVACLALMFVASASFGGYILHVKHAAEYQRDLVWQTRLAKATAEHEAQIRRIREASEAAAEAARSQAAAAVIEHQTRAQALEQELANLRDDPIVFPRAVAKALRR